MKAILTLFIFMLPMIAYSQNCNDCLQRDNALGTQLVMVDLTQYLTQQDVS